MSAVRGPLHEHILVRLADEGIPIGALVRGFNRTHEDVVRILGEAVERGLILQLPAADWPPGSRRVEREPTFRQERLADEQTMLLRLIGRLGISAQQAAILAALASRRECTRTYLFNAVWGDKLDQPDPKILDVQLCKLRKAVAPHGVTIKTVWGKGYGMSKESVERVRLLCASEAGHG